MSKNKGKGFKQNQQPKKLSLEEQRRLDHQKRRQEEGENLIKRVYNENFKNEVKTVQQFKGTVGKPTSLLANWYPLNFIEQSVHHYDFVIIGLDKKSKNIKSIKNKIFWKFFETHQNIFYLDYNQIYFDDESTFFTLRSIRGLEKANDEHCFKFGCNGDFGYHNVEILLRYNAMIQFPRTDQRNNRLSFAPIHCYIAWCMVTQIHRMPEQWRIRHFQNNPDASIYVAQGSEIIKSQFNYGYVDRHIDWMYHLYGNNQNLAYTHYHLPIQFDRSQSIIDIMSRLYLGLRVKIVTGIDQKPYITCGIVNKFLVNFNLPVIQYYAFLVRGKELSRQQLIQLASRRRSMNEEQKTRFNTLFKGLVLKLAYDNQLHFKFRQLTKHNSNDIFKFGKEMLAVKDYFLKYYGVKLRFPHLPLIQFEKLPYPVPIELCKISMSSQRARKKLTRRISDRICRAATLDPLAYFDQVSNMTQHSIIENNEHLNEFGMSFDLQDGRLKPMIMEGRIIPHPECDYTQENPQERPIAIPARPTYLIACTANVHHRFVDKDEFIRKFVNTGLEKGMTFINPNQNFDCTDESFTSFESVRDYIRENKKLHKNDVDFYHHSVLFFFILGDHADELYKWIKSCGDLLEGVPTQCVNAENLRTLMTPETETELNSMTHNLVAKVTDKLGGTMNRIYDKEFESICNKVFVKYTNNDEEPTMFLGIFAMRPQNDQKYDSTNGKQSKDTASSSKDVASTSKNVASTSKMDPKNEENNKNSLKNKKILTMSFNIDNAATKFCHMFDFAENDKYEIIEDELKNLFVEAVKFFRARIGRMPAKVFLYRIGVTDNKAKEIARHEVDTFYQAWRKCKQDIHDLKDPMPKIVYILADRTHKTRFMKNPDEAGSSQEPIRDFNMERGTVVDDYITTNNDFYLCSHKTNRGTVRPAHYTIHDNSLNISSDDLQLLTFALCFLVQRSIYSVAVPAPIHYAKLLCDRVSEYLKANNSEHPRLHYKMVKSNFIA